LTDYDHDPLPISTRVKITGRNHELLATIISKPSHTFGRNSNYLIRIDGSSDKSDYHVSNFEIISYPLTEEELIKDYCID